MNEQLTVGSGFAGLGGFDLGFERAGMRTIWQCEIDPWCQRVLKKHWPSVKRYGDIRTVTADTAIAPDVFCAGFPCQPVSIAGKRLAQEDERWLWPECARIVGEIRPRYVVLENVPGLLGRGMGDVLGDLAALGYDAEWGCIRASDAGAPHKRERVWIVAYPNGAGLEGRRLPSSEGSQVSGAGNGGSYVADANRQPIPTLGRPREMAGTTRARKADSQQRERNGDAVDNRGTPLADADGIRRERARAARTGRIGLANGCSGIRTDHWEVEPNVGRVANGVPNRVDRLRGLGNALVPQIAEWIGRQIVEFESTVQNR